MKILSSLTLVNELPVSERAQSVKCVQSALIIYLRSAVNSIRSTEKSNSRLELVKCELTRTEGNKHQGHS